MQPAVRKALFLDRDGVINVDAGYVHKPEQVVFTDGIFDLCRAAKALGYLLIVITNQSGIGRGYYSEEDFHHLMRWMQERFAQEHCALDSYYFCPHHPEHGLGHYRQECACRKPKPGMLHQARDQFNIDLSQSYIIGDHGRDVLAGKAAGCSTIFMDYDYRKEITPVFYPHYTCHSLAEAIAWLD
jgi:D-glycero-D-manno-heptose 1,7-bisphosphate phosphatase